MPLLTIDELGKLSPFFRGPIGNALAYGLMHVLSVDKVNDLYDRNAGLSGVDFSSAVLRNIGLDYIVSCDEAMSGLPDGPFITISNHPCGHVDGITLVDYFARQRPDYKVMVNKILAGIKPLEDIFIPVTPIGKEKGTPDAESVRGVKAALRHLRAGGALGLFPAGAVSDFSLKDRRVRDRQWQEPVIKLIMKARVPVVPVYFHDGNSSFYYFLGLIDWRIRLLRLPGEVFNKSGMTMHVKIGPVISVEDISRYGNDWVALSDFLRARVYGMVK